MDACPICGTPYGKRKRCYVCQPGKPKTGAERKCAECGKAFYAQANQIADTKRRQGTYCSNRCKYVAMRRFVPPWAKPSETRLSSAGYVLVWAPGHPKANGGRVMEHVLVMEQVLGGPIPHGKEIHHIDFNKQNNDPSNLLLVTASEHQQYHPQEQKRVTVSCQECGKAFDVKPSRANTDDPANLRKYCSLACRHKAWGRQMHAKRKDKLGY